MEMFDIGFAARKPPRFPIPDNPHTVPYRVNLLAQSLPSSLTFCHSHSDVARVMAEGMGTPHRNRTEAAQRCPHIRHRFDDHKLVHVHTKIVIGVGHGEKQQIHMILKILMPKAEFKGNDAADALAIAICHAHNRGGNRMRMAAVLAAG